MWIDAHAHLADSAFDEDRNEVIQRAKDAGLAKIVLIGCDVEGAQRALKLAYTDDLFDVAIGFHPGGVLEDRDEAMMFELMKDPKVKLIGEIGLDFYWDKDFEHHKLQETLFLKQIEWANQLNKPISIHMRDASKKTHDILKTHPVHCGGVMHCYSGSVEMAREFIKLGYFISLAGPVTFKNAHVPKNIARDIPLEWLLIETDSPYLAPHPYRGKRNESSYVVETAKVIAELRGMSIADLEAALETNYNRLTQV